MSLDGLDGHFTPVEDARGQAGLDICSVKHLGEVFHATGAAGCNYRYAHRIAYRFNQLQIESGQWFEFVLSILEHHYDIAYRRPGSEGGNYQPPSDTIALTDASSATLKAAAATLLT